MGLSLGTPITFDAAGIIAIAFLDSRRLLVIYSEGGSTKIRVVDVINRVLGDGVVLTRGGEDLVGVDSSRALVVYAHATEDANPPFGQFCKVVVVDDMTITGIGSEAEISDDSSGRSLTLSKIQTRKAFVLYRFDDGGSNKIKAKIVNIAGATATPQAEITFNTGTTSVLNVETLGITGTNSIISSWHEGSNVFAALSTTSGNTITIRDQVIVDTGVVALSPQIHRELVTFNNIFATSYREGGVDTITAGIVVSNILAIGLPLGGIEGVALAPLPGNKFIAIEAQATTGEINQISAVNAVLTNNSVPIVLGVDTFSTSPIGNCVAIGYMAEAGGSLSIVMLTQQAQFYQGSGAFGGANRLIKKADLPIPGVKPNAIDISGSGLAVLGAQAGAPCQEEQVIISAVEPYATWENQSKNYPTGSAVTSIKFV